jgi:hypothetical protein
MKIIKLEEWINLFHIMIFGMFKITYDTSNILKKDKERIMKAPKVSNRMKKFIEKLALNFPNISNIKRLQPKSEHKFRFRK